MRLLVTGGAGFIGSNFVHYWFKNHPSDSIVTLDKLTYAGNLENLASLEENTNHSFVKADINDSKVVDSLVAETDIIVHFAAETHVDRSITGPDAFIQTNVNGTFTLLEAARKHKKRFHHVSTDEVFGSLDLGSDSKFTEETPYDPSSPYSASKAASDHLVRAYNRTYGLETTISNCSNNYGPYMFPEKFIPLAITNLLEGKKIPIYGEGNQIRDWLFVDDHCQAIDRIISRGVIGETYLVGGMTKNITNLEVAKLILTLMKKDESSLEFVSDRPGHDVRYSVDWSKTHTELGYQPAFEFETYLQKTIDWYVENEPWWRRVKSGEYQEYYAKQYGQSK